MNAALMAELLAEGVALTIGIAMVRGFWRLSKSRSVGLGRVSQKLAGSASYGEVMNPASQSFGRRLRLERERLGISLEAIAASTKIKRSLLADLERDNVSKWPQGIYRRAFVREYAAAIGLPADAVVTEFLELFPEEGTPAGARSLRTESSNGLRLTLAENRNRELIGRVRRLLVATGELWCRPESGMAAHACYRSGVLECVRGDRIDVLPNSGGMLDSRSDVQVAAAHVAVHRIRPTLRWAVRPGVDPAGSASDARTTGKFEE